MGLPRQRLFLDDAHPVSGEKKMPQAILLLH
jgi:hypothetical protein